MLFLAVLAVAMATVRAAGGRYETLSQLEVRGAWLVMAALLLQIVAISLLVDPPPLLAEALHVLSYAVVAVFLWLNRALPGLLLVALGAGCNLLAILANGGTMPARASALRSAGISIDPEHFANSAVVAHPRLGLLGDIFSVPETAGLLANVFSIGDVLLAVGAVWLVHAAAGCRWPVGRPAGRPAGAVPLLTGTGDGPLKDRARGR